MRVLGEVGRLWKGGRQEWGGGEGDREAVAERVQEI